MENVDGRCEDHPIFIHKLKVLLGSHKIKIKKKTFLLPLTYFYM